MSGSYLNNSVASIVLFILGIGIGWVWGSQYPEHDNKNQSPPLRTKAIEEKAPKKIPCPARCINNSPQFGNDSWDNVSKPGKPQSSELNQDSYKGSIPDSSTMQLSPIQETAKEYFDIMEARPESVPSDTAIPNDSCNKFADINLRVECSRAIDREINARIALCRLIDDEIEQDLCLDKAEDNLAYP